MQPTMNQCHICSNMKPCQPYGFGRKPICLACSQSDPEIRAVAEMYARENLVKRMIDNFHAFAPLFNAMPIPLNDVEAALAVFDHVAPHLEPNERTDAAGTLLAVYGMGYPAIEARLDATLRRLNPANSPFEQLSELLKQKRECDCPACQRERERAAAHAN